MGRNPAQLNGKQAEVLNWIGDGCPAGVYEDGYDHRIVARALAHRGLVTVTGHGSGWTARITDAGMAHTTAPRPETPPHGPEPAEEALPGNGGPPAGPLSHRGAWPPAEGDSRNGAEPLPRNGAEPPATGGSANGARPTAEPPSRSEVASPARTDCAPPADPASPNGTEPPEPEADRPTTPVPIPTHGTRATRILRAIVDEARRRGMPARAANTRIALRAPAGTYDIRLREVPGKLALLVHGPGLDGVRYGDTAAATLEEKLPDLFQSLEIHQRRAEQQRRHRAEAVARAETRARWAHFTQRSREWRAITQHRAFLAATRAAVDAYDGPDRDDIIERLAEAERMLDERDPAKHPNLLLD